MTFSLNREGQDKIRAQLQKSLGRAPTRREQKRAEKKHVDQAMSDINRELRKAGMI